MDATAASHLIQQLRAAELTTLIQAHVLAAIVETESTCLTDLCEKLDSRPGHIGQILDRLEALGLCVRGESLSADSRWRSVSPTSSGRLLIERILSPNPHE